MKKRKELFIPLIMMLIITSSLISNSELENTRLIDIVQLVVLGMILGVFIINLKTTFWKK